MTSFVTVSQWLCKISAPAALGKEEVAVQHNGVISRMGSFALILAVTVLGRSDFSWHFCAHPPCSVQSQWQNSCQRCSAVVSEREEHHEALSISSEAELSNNLPGDDLDECLLYGGELCQHLCINTVGSYKCSCFPEFTLQEDGTSCSPGEKRDMKGSIFIPSLISQPFL